MPEELNKLRDLLVVVAVLQSLQTLGVTVAMSKKILGYKPTSVIITRGFTVITEVNCCYVVMV